MRTLVLAEAPFRDLRSRAMMEGIPKRFGATGRVLVTSSDGACPEGFDAVPAVPSAAALRAKRVVIAGIFRSRIQLERALYVARQARERGAVIETHCLSIIDDAARQEPPAGVAVLDTMPAVEVREYRTADTVLTWRVSAPVQIAAYPEREVVPDPVISAGLPDGQLLGLSILDGADARQEILAHGQALQALVVRARDWPLVPLPAEAPGSPADEITGSQFFAQTVLPGSSWLLPDMLKRKTGAGDLSPAALKGLVAKCALIVTNQDTVASFAVAAGVPVIGIKLGTERRIATCLAALANQLPTGSELIFGARYVPPPA